MLAAAPAFAQGTGSPNAGVGGAMTSGNAAAGQGTSGNTMGNSNDSTGGSANLPKPGVSSAMPDNTQSGGNLNTPSKTSTP